MKFTKKFFLASLTFIFASMSLFAQDEVSLEVKKRGEQRIEQAAEKLNLSEEQKTAFAEIHKKYKNEAKALKGSTQSRDEMMDLIYKNRKAKNAELKNLLSPEQYAIYDKIDENRKGRKGRRGGKGKRKKNNNIEEY